MIAILFYENEIVLIFRIKFFIKNIYSDV